MRIAVDGWVGHRLEPFNPAEPHISLLVSFGAKADAPMSGFRIEGFDDVAQNGGSCQKAALVYQ